MDSQVRHPKKASHSGPLAQRAAWAKANRNPDEPPKISTGTETFATSGLVAARRSMLAEDCREKSDSSQGEVQKLIGRFPGSFKETSESSMLPDQKFSNHSIAGSHDKERSSTKDPIVVSMQIPFYRVFKFIFLVLPQYQPVKLIHLLLPSFLSVCLCVYTTNTTGGLWLEGS